MAWKQFVAGEEALAADINTYLMGQTVARFANAAARTAAVPAPTLNQMSVLDSAPGGIDYWNGSAWVTAGGSRELQYTQITAAKTITQAAEGVADAVITGAALTYDGTTAVLIEVF